MTPHPSFACRFCDGPISFERCTDYHDTGHPHLVAMQCNRCGNRHEWQCKQCRHERDLDDRFAAMWEAWDAD